MVEGVGVLAKQCNEDYLRLRLDETEIILEMEESEPES